MFQVSAVNCRYALRCVVECCNSLAKYLEDQGPNKAMDVDELLLRESMDVIGESQNNLTTSVFLSVPERSEPC